MWPATWRQNDAGAAETPGLVADQCGLYANRSVSKVSACFIGLALPTRALRFSQGLEDGTKGIPYGVHSSFPSSHRPDCLQWSDNDMRIKSRLLNKG